MNIQFKSCYAAPLQLIMRILYTIKYLIPLLLLSSFFTNIYAQLHNTPSCSPNIVTGLDWGTNSGEANWTPSGALTFNTLVDGHTFTYTLTGNTTTLSGSPTIGSSLAGSTELELYTNGLGGGGITVTIDISPPIQGDVGMSFYHVNSGGAGSSGDKLTISASYLGGSTIFPTFTTPANADYTVNSGTGVADADGTGTDYRLGINWSTSFIDEITILWEDCNICSSDYHGVAIGGIDFCSCAYSGTFQAENACSFFDTDPLNLTHNNDHNSSGTHTQTYALTDNAGQILATNSSPNFAAQTEGDYQVYAINYETAEGISNYSIGNNISGVTGDCIYTSSVDFMVCSCSFKAQEPIIINTAGGSIGDGDMTIRYLLTDNSGIILGISPDPVFAGQAEGSYLVYSLAYETAEGISNLAEGNNVSVVTGSCFDLSSSLSIGVCGLIPTCARYELITKH